jgi:hypothetical protein
MLNPRVLAGGVVTIALMAIVAWVFLLSGPPKGAPTLPPLPDEPWPGATQMAGAWRLVQEKPYREGNCAGSDGSFYHLTLEHPRKLVPTLSGAMNVRLTRSGGDAACRRFDRRMRYDVLVARGPASLLEMTMTATSCSEDGKDCPLADRKIYFRPLADALVFGENRLTRYRP